MDVEWEESKSEKDMKVQKRFHTTIVDEERALQLLLSTFSLGKSAYVQKRIEVAGISLLHNDRDCIVCFIRQVRIWQPHAERMSFLACRLLRYYRFSL